MQSELPLYPEQASNFAPQVDGLVLFMIAVCAFFAVVICAAVIYFFFKYQRKHADEAGVPIHGDMRLEIAWIVLPFFLLMAMFGWDSIRQAEHYTRKANQEKLAGRAMHLLAREHEKVG